VRARLLAGFLIAALSSVAGRAPCAPRLLFRFSAGAGLFARPGLGHDGSLYVGSGDGYVHALAPDGSFRWSYTVKGRVAAPPVEEPKSGRVFVATSEGRLYALESDAQLRWVFPLPAPPKTELVLTPKGTLFFVGQDDHLYGVTTGGALGLRLTAAGARSAPVVLEGGRLALVLGDSLATLKGYGYERAALGAVVSGSAKLALDAERGLLVCEERRARVIRAGSERRLDSDCLTPPVSGDGFVAVAEASAMARIAFNNGQSEQIALGSAPLRPVWDAARQRLVLATATGEVSVLALAGAP